MTVIVLTPDQLEDVIERAIGRALAGRQRPPDELLTTEQAAEASGVTAKTVRIWIANGLRTTRRGRRHVIARADLYAWRTGTPVTAALVSTLTTRDS